MIEDFKNTVISGDSVRVLKDMPDESIDCIITSPPYYGLRDYGIEGQIGLEKTPEEYVNKLMEVFKECKRVLKNTGTFWLNIGDTYASSGTERFDKKEYDGKSGIHCGRGRTNSYQPKCMLMMPERIAFALISDDWILRNKIIWYKRNHMPSSVKDRFSSSWEYVYFFSKSKKYFFDLDAVREAHSSYAIERAKRESERELHTQIKDNKWINAQEKGIKDSMKGLHGKSYADIYKGKFDGAGEKAEQFGSPRARNERKIDETAKFFIEKGSGGNVNLPGEHLLGKNPGDFWDITTKPFKESHFTVFPEELCIKPIKAGCPEFVCKKCGKAKQIIRSGGYPNAFNIRVRDVKEGRIKHIDRRASEEEIEDYNEESYCPEEKIKIIECSCNAGYDGGIVLDPFCGAGTALVVAKKLGRNYIGIDLKPEYCEMARKRLSTVPERLDSYKT